MVKALCLRSGKQRLEGVVMVGWHGEGGGSGVKRTEGPSLQSRGMRFVRGLGSSPRSCLQVTVGSGRPTARQSRFTLPPSFTVTGEEMFTMRAGTAGGERDQQWLDTLSRGPGPASSLRLRGEGALARPPLS